MTSVATVVMLAALAGAPVPLEPALGAIVKAQAAQAAARAYRVMRRSTDPKGGATTTVAVLFVSPDRYHARWEDPKGDEIIRIGERGWWNMGKGGRWELEPRFTSINMLRRLRGPATVEAALRGALHEGPAQQAEFLLYAGDDVKWSSIERLLDAASAAGSTRVSLGVRSDSGEESVLRARIRTTPVPSAALPSHLVAISVSGSGPTQVLTLNGLEHGVDWFQSSVRDIFETRSDHLIDVMADGARTYQDVVSLIDILAGAGGDVVLTTSSTARRFFLKAPLPPPSSGKPGDVRGEAGGAGQKTRLRGVRVGGDIKEPAKLHDVRPVYPGIAQEARVQGAITLECKISPEGRVTDVEVLRGIPLLDQSAIDAVKEWRYAPTLVKGVPVSVILTVTVNFELTPPTSRPKRNPR